jgi:hypothetical protein
MANTSVNCYRAPKSKLMLESVGVRKMAQSVRNVWTRRGRPGRLWTPNGLENL